MQCEAVVDDSGAVICGCRYYKGLLSQKQRQIETLKVRAQTQAAGHSAASFAG